MIIPNIAISASTVGEENEGGEEQINKQTVTWKQKQNEGMDGNKCSDNDFFRFRYGGK